MSVARQAHWFAENLTKFKLYNSYIYTTVIIIHQFGILYSYFAFSPLPSPLVSARNCRVAADMVSVADVVDSMLVCVFHQR